MDKSFLVKMPEKTHRKLKLQSVMSGVSMQDIVLSMIEKCLAEEKTELKK